MIEEWRARTCTECGEPIKITVDMDGPYERQGSGPSVLVRVEHLREKVVEPIVWRDLLYTMSMVDVIELEVRRAMRTVIFTAHWVNPGVDDTES